MNREIGEHGFDKIDSEEDVVFGNNELSEQPAGKSNKKTVLKFYPGGVFASEAGPVNLIKMSHRKNGKASKDQINKPEVKIEPSAIENESPEVQLAYKGTLEVYQTGDSPLEDLEEFINDSDETDNASFVRAIKILIEDIKSGRVASPDVSTIKKEEFEIKERKEKNILENWIEEHVTHSTHKWAELSGPERQVANRRFIASTKSVWGYFVEGKKWHLRDKNGSVVLGDISDDDAKITLYFLKKAGLESALYEYLSGPQLNKSDDTTDTNKAVEQFNKADCFEIEDIPPSASETMWHLLMAGGHPRFNNGNSRFLVNLASDSLSNEIMTKPDHLLNSARTLRGLKSFIPASKIVAYANKYHKSAGGKTWEERYENLLDREFSNSDLTDFGIIRTNAKGKEYFNGFKKRQELISRAVSILSEKESKLKEEGRVVDSPTWGKAFVNIARTAKERFPGGAAAIRAMDKYEAYLQLDLGQQSFLFRPLKEIKGNKPDIPLEGKWVYDMYLKLGDGKKFSKSEFEIMQNFLGQDYKPVGKIKELLENRVEHLSVDDK